MNKIFFLFSILILIDTQSSFAQCSGEDTLIYGFNDPGGNGIYSGFLCSGTDSVGTAGANGYYNGDGYRINLVSGTQVIFSIDSCNGVAASLTIADSLKNVIPGAYAVAACPNSLDFTATYTGTYIVFINVDGICNVFGNTIIGQAHVKIKTGTMIPDCPVANVVNDTICGATPLQLNSFFESGNTAEAYPTDPLDTYVTSQGFVCSPPNNTLWYSFTAPTDLDTVIIWFTSKPGNGFHSWLGIFQANDPGNSCSGGLTYINCAEGANDNLGIDTVSIPLTGISAGQVYYFMVDGYNGDTGEFSIALKLPPFTSVNEINPENNYTIFPNPAKNVVEINSTYSKEATLIFYNSFGQIVFKKEFENLLNEKIDVSFFTSGIYFVKIINRKSESTLKLVIK